MEAEKVAGILLARQLLREQEGRADSTVVERPDRTYIAGETFDERFADLERLILMLCPDPTPYEDKRFIDGATPELTISVEHNGQPVELELSFSIGKGINEHCVMVSWSLENSDPFDTYVEILNKDEKDEEAFARIDWSLTQYLESVGQMTEQQLVDVGFPAQFIENQQEAKRLPPF